MKGSVEVICSDLSETDVLAEKFSKCIENDGAFVCLYGNIGAGKTAFVKSVCKYLGVDETVTSPSFVILNEYKSGKLPVYHFDLYRLENEGISSIRNELEEYSEGRLITFMEWAQFSPDETLPFDEIIVNIETLGETERKFVFEAYGKKSENSLMKLKELIYENTDV